MSEPATDDYTTLSASAYSDVVLPTVDHSAFAQDPKAQHALLALVYEKLAIEHRTSNHQLFLALDPERRGVLAPVQFRQALAGVGVPLTAEQLAWLVGSFDLDRDHGLDYGEFVRLLAASRAGKVGGAAAGQAPGKTGLEWAPEPQGSPFKAADDAREEVRVRLCVCACVLGSGRRLIPWSVHLNQTHHSSLLCTTYQRKRLVLARYAEMLHAAAAKAVMEGASTAATTSAATSSTGTQTEAAAPLTEEEAMVQAVLLRLAGVVFEKLGGLKRGFKHVDGDGDNMISAADLAHCLEHHLGLVLPGREFQALFKTLDFEGGSVCVCVFQSHGILPPSCLRAPRSHAPPPIQHTTQYRHRHHPLPRVDPRHDQVRRGH